MPHGNDRRDDRRIVGISRDVTDEGIVDLELLHREALEIRHRGIRQAEVVDDQRHPHLVETQHLGLGAVRPLHHPALRDLELKTLAGQTAGRQGRRHRISQALVLELAARDIDRQATKFQSLLTPLLCLVAGLVQYPCTQRHDQPAFLGDRDKERRWHLFTVIVLPAQQRLDPDQAAGRQIELRLVTQAELVPFQCPTQLAAEHPTRLRAPVHLRFVEGVAVLAAFFRLVHRGIGLFEQGRHVTAVVGEHRDADTGGHETLVAAQLIRLVDDLQQLIAGDLHITVLVDITQHHGELVTTDACNDVGLAQA